MQKRNIIWSEQEFEAYLLLFCSNADLEESEEERELILDKVGEDTYKRMHREFEKDNDYQRIQKIQSHIEHNEVSKDQVNALCKNLYSSDGDFNYMEKNIHRALKRILDL